MALKIENLCKSFGDKRVLSDLTLELEDGGIYCLMGPSGMGKTTLLRIILGLETADSGSVTGVRTSEISAMFQEDRLIPSLTAVENVALVSPWKAKRSEIVQQLSEILPEDCLRQPVAQLSGGMKRRVALARAMRYPSRMIILDEPFTGLDQETRMAVISFVLETRGDRILLVATHGMDDAALLGAKVIQLDELQAQEPEEEEEEALNPALTLEEALLGVKMFEGLPEERLREIVEKLNGREVDYKAKDVVWQQFDECSDIGIVLKGSVQAENLSREEPLIIQRFSAGNSFGEGIAFGEQTTWVRVSAAEDTRVLFLSATALLENRTDPDMVHIMVNLLGEFSTKLELMSLKNQLLSEPRVRNKVLMYLSTLPDEKDGWKTIPFLQKDLAQYLNVNRSSFNRELGRMKDDGILEMKGSRVRVNWKKCPMERWE